MPTKIKILSVRSFVNPKDGRTLHVATAEIPAWVPDGWSTVRLSCIRDIAFPSNIKPGVEIPLVLTGFDHRDGKGTFRV